MNLANFGRSILVVIVLQAASARGAVQFDFSDSSDGTFTGSMEVNIVGSTLTAVIKNLSPNQAFEPALAGFGFNLDSPVPAVSSWSLTAFELDGDPETIGGSGTSTGDWVLAATIDGVSLDFGAETDNGVKGALYAPGVNGSYGGPPQFSTGDGGMTHDGAILTVVFASAPTLATGDDVAFMRVQNFGARGEGSLKLFDDNNEGGGGGGQVPEPASVLVWGLLGVAVVLFRRRRSR